MRGFPNGTPKSTFTTFPKLGKLRNEPEKPLMTSVALMETKELAPEKLIDERFGFDSQRRYPTSLIWANLG